MTNIHITVSGAEASAVTEGPLTRGAVGLPVTFTFDESWAGLIRTAVFRAGGLTVDRVGVGESTTVPAGILEKCGCTVYVGVCGTAADGSVVVPTVWAEAGTVRPGADPSGDESTDPALPVWAQLAADLGAVDTALDHILAIEQQLIGGAGA